ncbi:MAG: hypothetical protein Q9M48_11105 [Rhodobacterales bacterium]|nr:hypothetical protein [Rhodobacterales bacterium]
MKFKNLLLAASLVFGTPAVALDICNRDSTTLQAELNSSLSGPWTVRNTVGTLRFGNRVMPLPSGNASRANITATGAGMTISLPDIGTYPLLKATDVRFVLNAPSRQMLELGENLFGKGPAIATSDELGILGGCADAMLPQLFAKGVYQDPEGPVDFELFLFVVHDDLLYGIIKGELKSMGGVARRVIRFSR